MTRSETEGALPRRQVGRPVSRFDGKPSTGSAGFVARRLPALVLAAGLLLGLAWPSTAEGRDTGQSKAAYSFGPTGGMKPLAATAGGWTFKLRFAKADGIGNIPLLVEIREARRRPDLVSGIQASLSMPSMPEMGIERYVLSRDSLGQYVSAPLISMGGLWRIELEIARRELPPLTVPFEVDFEESR